MHGSVIVSVDDNKARKLKIQELYTSNLTPIFKRLPPSDTTPSSNTANLIAWIEKFDSPQLRCCSCCW